MAWVPGTSSSYEGIERGCIWWRGVGGYYVEPFYGERGVTQGEPLLPNISNVMLEAVVRHWESLVSEGGGEDVMDNSSGYEAAQPARKTIRA